MLYTRNAKYFREYYKVEKAQNRDKDVDVDFIDLKHPNPKNFKKGFGSLIFGSGRDNVENFLRSTVLNVAADQQSVYELIQNADDCDASFINISYNDKYLLCINNGKPFSDRNMAGLINVGDSDKTLEEIGTYGIGFKIVHRLLGEDDGADAIVKDFAGALIFSWNTFFQFDRFLKNDEIRVGWDREKDKENAWLIKLIYTCFPTHLEESVRVSNYDTEKVLFEKSELQEFRTFLSESLSNINISQENFLKTGSIFFIKLAEGKSKSIIEKNIEILKSGIAYSFNFLQSLKKIYINGESILAKEIKTHPILYPIGKEPFISINPRNKERQIEAKFGFTYSYKDRIASNIPNFYTFFSMDDEKNNLGFLIHCNAFDKHNDRRKLQPDSLSNPRLFSYLIPDILAFVESKKGEKFWDNSLKKTIEPFNELYATFLFSEEPKNKPQILEGIYLPIKKYLAENIPTLNRTFSNNPANVKIKNIRLNINPADDLGCSEIEWFAWWRSDDTAELIKESQKSEKLGLQEWDIVDLLKYAISKGCIEKVNDWVKKLEIETAQIFAEEKEQKEANPAKELPKRNKPYISLLHELNNNITKSNIDIISQIKLFKFSDGNYYSLNEIFANPNIVLIYDKLAKIKQELRFLGLVVSNLDISKNPNLLKMILPKINEEILFKAIAEKSKENNLRAGQKHNLFFTIVEFERVGAEKLKDLELFKDTQGNIRPLRTLLKGDLQVPNWLFGFKIHKAEYIPELDKFLVKENEIYQAIIYKNWDSLIEQIQNIKDFYSQVTTYYKQNPDNPRLEKLACISTNEGFKKPEQVFFNSNLNSRNFDDLQNAIFKIANKPTPNKLIFSFLTDDNSPFKISKNDTISNFITASYTLSYSETLAILEFAKNNNEKLFSIAYIQKQNDTLLLVNHSQSVFQYHSNRQEINELLSNQANFKLLPKEFNANDFRELGIWQDKGLYIKVLQNLEFSENLLPIIRESDKEVQLAYLEKLKNLSLQEGKVYDKNSFEHRCLKLAINCYADDFQTKFASKILINGKLRIKDIAVKDDINFESITLSLASVLPDYKGISDIITKIINQFSDFTRTELSEKVFPINNKKKDEIYSELVAKFPTLQNIEQFAFLLYYSKQTGKNFFTNQLLVALLNVDILQFAYRQKFTELTTFINVSLQDKIYPSELALESEKLPTWVLTWLESADKQEKLNFLSALKVHIENSNVCAIRRFFQTEQITDFQGKVFAIPQNSILLINTLKWLQGITFKASESTKLEGLKQIFNRLTYSTEIPLLYVSQITENEILYKLEVSSATKYYFEAPQKEYAQKIFEVLQSKDFKLIALDYFKHWQANIKPEKIATTEVLDIEKIKQNCNPWNDNAYNAWEAKSKYPIFIYEGERLPYKVLFLQTEIDTFTKDTSIKQENGVIYVCKSVSDIPQELLAKCI